MFDTLMGTRMKTTIGLLSYQKKINKNTLKLCTINGHEFVRWLSKQTEQSTPWELSLKLIFNPAKLINNAK